ncbi:helix-turn-helix transcriptional regulator [Pseudarthrobacter sp. BRE9]|uniref:helix-turn-helix domain-containing protein n=1 Tax=Pseudarthrobacter sp. BRE9 TaxID=2962582 RepID=UPI00288250B1|nr:helix-turn-helix transcriptional regulator [Pseudarthrobacter sp. BRE9]MDT0171056.1 helix-turn-helix transcriptional regulator [Pseudarthrobacter sp. BRE9]
MTNAFEGLEEALSTQIKVELVERGMDQKTLAERVGIHPVTMTKYLKNQRTMPVTTLFDIAAAFGISPRLLMQRAEARISRPAARRA